MILPSKNNPGSGAPQGAQGVVINRTQTAHLFTNVRGVQGLQGLYGIQGNQGALGTGGTIGLFGLQGFQGIQGSQGSQGIQGHSVVGDIGVYGHFGLQGNQGAQGNQGLFGFLNTDMILGAQGSQGNQGDAAGYQGLQGGSAPSPNHYMGPQGDDGLQGWQGAQSSGVQGIQGWQGLQGTQGPQGFQGMGLQGYQGSKGPTTPSILGSQGPQGRKGPIGLDGIQGNQGVQGRQQPYGDPFSALMFFDDFVGASLDVKYDAAPTGTTNTIESAAMQGVARLISGSSVQNAKLTIGALGIRNQNIIKSSFETAASVLGVPNDTTLYVGFINEIDDVKYGIYFTCVPGSPILVDIINQEDGSFFGLGIYNQHTTIETDVVLASSIGSTFNFTSFKIDTIEDGSDTTAYFYINSTLVHSGIISDYSIANIYDDAKPIIELQGVSRVCYVDYYYCRYTRG